MDHCQLAGTSLSCSRLIFGTGSLFGVGRSTERTRILDAAVDAGFTHFDTAPYYGFGVAERDLGALLKRHCHLTVTTKVGLYPRGGLNQGLGRVLARKMLGKIHSKVVRPETDFTLARAQRSLTGSLTRLGRDYVDLYLLHEPIADLIDVPAWVAWLERERSAGRIGAYGVAGEASSVAPLLPQKSPLTHFVQTSDSLAGKEASFLGQPPQITYGYIRMAAEHGSSDPVTILRAAIAQRPTSAIVVSTRKLDRVGQYARVFDRSYD